MFTTRNNANQTIRGTASPSKTVNYQEGKRGKCYQKSQKRKEGNGDGDDPGAGLTGMLCEKSVGTATGQCPHFWNECVVLHESVEALPFL